MVSGEMAFRDQHRSGEHEKRQAGVLVGLSRSIEGLSAAYPQYLSLEFIFWVEGGWEV